jgi:acylphosphatase
LALLPAAPERPVPVEVKSLEITVCAPSGGCGYDFAFAELEKSGPAVVAALTMMNRFRMHIWYSGRVQGVGFRYQTRNLATGFEVAGTVRNLLDGRVELIAEGSRDELEAFRIAIRESGLGPIIRDKQVN